MKVLITGGAGFIGSNMAKKLIEEDHEVFVIDNLFRGNLTNLSRIENHNNFNFKKVDLEYEISISIISNIIREYTIDTIIHYAAINGTQYFYDIPEKVAVANSIGTLNLLKGIENSGFKPKVIFASTSETYGDPEIIPTPEHATTYFRIQEDRDSYSVAKMMSEFYVKLFSQKLGLEFLILRIFNVYGKGMIGSKYGQVIPEFIQRLKQGEYPLKIFGNGQHTRSFCHIDDHVNLTYLLMLSKEMNSVINIGSDKEISIRELAQLIMTKMDLEPNFEFLPERKGDHTRRCPDITKLKSIVGDYNFIRLEKGIELSI